MVIPHWITVRSVSNGWDASLFTVGILGYYYSIVCKVCQPFFGVFDLLYYTAWLSHYSVRGATISHYVTTKATTAYDHHYSVTHYSVFTTDVVHYSVIAFTTAFGLTIWFLCVFLGCPEVPPSSSPQPLYSHYYIFCRGKLQGGGCSIRFVWCKCLILLTFLVRGEVPVCVVRGHPANLLILLDFFGSWAFRHR